ncbi:MAG: fumarate hydratase [Candidatus Brocadiales bacterium]|nr:fumarate hydratase [Candidatus Bathyanammoxibius amoris]
MRTVDTGTITETIKRLCVSANHELNDDLISALEEALKREESPVGRDVLSQILENARISRQGILPACQDTGATVVFARIGQDVRFAGGDFGESIQKGVSEGYKGGYLRASMVKDPFQRTNTGDNTPCMIHSEVVAGDALSLTVMAKGGGCENQSRIAILTPAAGRQGVIDFVVDVVRQGAARACPPNIIGVGLGGTFDTCALLAKKSLLRPVGSHNEDTIMRELEEELLDRINDLGIGPQGLGGRVTALAVHVEQSPCHIASLTVAVNVECHSHRVKSASI